MVDEAINILNSVADINEFGVLLDEAWRVKRQLSARVAPTFVNEIYDTAIKAGALGGKILGAGGGGFMLFFVPPNRQPDVLTALNSLLLVPIKFENAGSQIIFYNPEDYSRSSLAGRHFNRYLEAN